jgi:hypothetical protein
VLVYRVTANNVGCKWVVLGGESGGGGEGEKEREIDEGAGVLLILNTEDKLHLPSKSCFFGDLPTGSMAMLFETHGTGVISLLGIVMKPCFDPAFNWGGLGYLSLQNSPPLPIRRQPAEPIPHLVGDIH